MNRQIPRTSTSAEAIDRRPGVTRTNLGCFASAALAALLYAASPAAGGLQIPSGTTLTINGSVTTDYVNIASSGKLVITGTGTLTLTGDPNNVSTIDGGLELSAAGATLRITTNDHTFTGTGFIEGHDNSAWIEISGSRTLTSTTTIKGSLEIRAGTGTFDNDGTVEANRSGASNDTLTCYNGTFAGSGEYKVSASGSTLKFRLGISDTGLAADFKLTAGTLDIDEEVVTTGEHEQTGGTLDVAPGKKFQAS